MDELTLRPTADVREVLYLADITLRQRAKRLKASVSDNAQPTAEDCWLAIASTARPFSLAARLLKGIGLSAKTIKTSLKPPVKTTASLEETTDWLSQAQTVAQQLGDTKHITLAHLLIALGQAAPTSELLEPLTQQASQASVIKANEAQQAKAGPFTRHTWQQMAFYLRETLEMLVVMVVFLMVIKEGLGELRLIPSESMVPTLQIGDRLVIEKATRWFHPPERGDVVVFYPPEPDAILHHDPLSFVMRSTGFSSLFHNSSDDPIDKAYIKRLIGLPGDTVWMINNHGMVINGQLLEEPYINAVGLECGNLCLPVTIPDDHYLLLGDNRNRSKDGRFFGFVHKDRLVGRAVFRIWPLARIGAVE